MIDITKYTKEDFENVPYYSKIVGIEETEKLIIDSLIIIPREVLHDSGWATMDFVALDKEGQIMYKFSFGSDVLHLDGIGGLNALTSKPGWAIDCLPCGYLRIFCQKQIQYIGGISDFQVIGGVK